MIILQDLPDSAYAILDSQVRAILIQQDESITQFGAFRASVAQIESNDPRWFAANATFESEDGRAKQFVLKPSSLTSGQPRPAPEWRQIRAAIFDNRGFSKLDRFVSIKGACAP